RSGCRTRTRRADTQRENRNGGSTPNLPISRYRIRSSWRNQYMSADSSDCENHNGLQHIVRMKKQSESLNSTSDNGFSGGSQTVSRAMEILRLVACGQEIGVRLTDLVQMSGLSRPTVHRLLKTLLADGAVEQDELSRRYRIGQEMIVLGSARTRRFPLLHIAGSGVEHIAQTGADTAFLSIRHALD